MQALFTEIFGSEVGDRRGQNRPGANSTDWRFQKLSKEIFREESLIS